ncbi:MAG: Uma2 family endonuclease [Aeromicrobium sp.]|uniref:Uma2 family endonuclease n=1 Tax=Aeromicrobium sp. TaxID=1871063 RepID=UPI0039E4ACA0
METLQVEGPWTVAQRDALPDDGRRYEVVDGVLLVSPAPRPAHQGVVALLWHLLHDAAPSGLRVYFAPLDVVLAGDTVVEPDVLVAPREAFTDLNLPSAPLLAVEVLSPGTRMIDLNLKKQRYERAGIPSYWVIDPDTLVLTVFERRDGTYAGVAEVGPGQSWTAERPFPVTITPEDLRY